MNDHWLDAMEYAMRPKEPRHLRGWRKVWSWLRSRPLARVRRNLATEKRIREQFRADLPTALLSAEMKRFYNRGALSSEGVRREIERVGRLIEEYHHEG